MQVSRERRRTEGTQPHCEAQQFHQQLCHWRTDNPIGVDHGGHDSHYNAGRLISAAGDGLRKDFPVVAEATQPSRHSRGRFRQSRHGQGLPSAGVVELERLVPQRRIVRFCEQIVDVLRKSSKREA